MVNRTPSLSGPDIIRKESNREAVAPRRSGTGGEREADQQTGGIS
jgi:hypothetical protein